MHGGAPQKSGLGHSLQPGQGSVPTSGQFPHIVEFAKVIVTSKQRKLVEQRGGWADMRLNSYFHAGHCLSHFRIYTLYRFTEGMSHFEMILCDYLWNWKKRWKNLWVLLRSASKIELKVIISSKIQMFPRLFLLPSGQCLPTSAMEMEWSRAKIGHSLRLFLGCSKCSKCCKCLSKLLICHKVSE